MTFGRAGSALAIISGLAAAGLQIAVLLILLVKIVSGEFDPSAAFSLVVLIILAAAAFAGFWLLRQSPEFGYFALTVGAAAFLFVAGFLALSTVGFFLLPGSMALMASAIAFLLAGEDRLPIWRKAGIILFAAVWLLSFAGQLYGAADLLNVPAAKSPAKKRKAQTDFKVLDILKRRC